jgi:hypothetical protein
MAALSTEAAAQANGPPAPAAPAPVAPPRIVEVRMAIAPAAAQHLSEPRLRQLLEIELGDSAVLAPGMSGPLGDHVAYVWIDEPTPAQVLIEVRIGERAVARREISVAGFPGDVAVRFVVVATAEMVRSQMQPVRRRPHPRRPTAEEIEIASREWSAVVFQAGAGSAFLPGASGGLAGTSLSVAFRNFGVTPSLFGRWYLGRAEGGPLRWLEAGVSADYRLWASPWLRFAAGGLATVAAVHLAEARAVDGVADQVDSWSARAGGLVAAEFRLGGGFWLGLGLEPGAILRPVPYRGTTPAETFLRGAFLAANLTLTYEHRIHRSP